MSVVVGVDIGSSAARAVALDRDGAVLSYASTQYDGVESWPIGYADPKSWKRAIESSLLEIASNTPGPSKPAALGVGGLSPTTVSADSKIALTYQHSVGVEGGFEGQHQAHRRVIAEQLPGVAVCQSWDWALSALGAPHSQSSWPGFEPLLGFGPPRRTGEVVGSSDGQWGVAEGTPLVGGAPDAILTCWAAGLDRPGRACDPGGRTGGLFVAARPGAKAALDLFSFDSPSREARIFGGPVSAHGRALEWLASVTSLSVEALLGAAEDSPRGAGGVIFLPYLAGEREPRWRDDLRGEFVGLSLDTGPGDLARAVLEGSAYGLAHIAQSLRESGVSADVVMSTGSPSKSRLWCEIKAAVLEVPVEVSSFTELSAYGAALAAGAGAGWWPAPGEAIIGSWPRPPGSTVQPVACEEYRDGLSSFIALGDEAERRNDRSRS